MMASHAPCARTDLFDILLCAFASYVLLRLFYVSGSFLELELLTKRPFHPLTSWRTPIHSLKPHSDPSASGKPSWTRGLLWPCPQTGARLP